MANTHFAGGFDWDVGNRKVVVTQSRNAYPHQRTFDFNVLQVMCTKQIRGRAYENELQMYFTANIGQNINLNPIVGDRPVWFGNEVPCGVGMQKIDVLTICHEAERRTYRIIELKDEPVEPSITDQIEYYVNWASQDYGRHLDGAFNWNIQPVVVAPPHKSRNWQGVIDAFKSFNEKQISLPALYFEFTITSGQEIVFERVQY